MQDLGVFSYLKEVFPDLPLHASTQMTVLGADGAAFLKEQGAARGGDRKGAFPGRNPPDSRYGRDRDRELCARSALLLLFRAVPVQQYAGGRSGNRGRCAQPCRLPYQWKDGSRVLNSPKESYLLSPKDMCTIEILPQILQAGVCSLKIEGRMKRPEYTAGVVRIYRKYLDRCLEYGERRVPCGKKGLCRASGPL